MSQTIVDAFLPLLIKPPRRPNQSWESLIQGLACLAVDWLSQSAMRVGAMRGLSPGVRE